MKKKIFATMIILTMVTTILSGLLVTGVYYKFYLSQAKTELQSAANLVIRDSALKEDGLEREDYARIFTDISRSLVYKFRVTVTSLDGEVIYDTDDQGRPLDNHSSRPEIMEAMGGESSDGMRLSQTTGKVTYYYALKLDDSVIVRFSRDLDSLWGIFSDALPLAVVAMLLVILISIPASSALVNMIIRPVNAAAKSFDQILDHTDENHTWNVDMPYEELQPFKLKLNELKSKVDEYVHTLERERVTLDAITANMHEGLILLDSDFIIHSINKSASAMLDGHGTAQSSGVNFMKVIRDNQLISKIDQVIGSSRHSVFDYEINGLNLRFFINPIEEAGEEGECLRSGARHRVLIIIVDMSDELRAETVRKEFSSNVSHELKTPLTTICGFGELIGEGLITNAEDVSKYGKMINKEAKRLINLIDDIIRLSEIEEVGNTRELSVINLQSEAENVIELLEDRAEQKNVTLCLKADEVLINANKSYIDELIYNIVDNAIKYNRPFGKVNVSIRDEDGLAEIVVADTGIGIPHEHLDRIFERFYRVDKSRSKETGGTGLGLSIVKHIVQFHRGEIEIESEEGKGTVMTVHLPLRS